ncbi:hypothetical protein LK09_19320 [Microbacterium mangrovi]|uniref:Cytochrome b561 bacterial/Ni-hydrogenase domain-containing protein n=1 Tax=Microbacterium mangrovi TaxID=1348253 RepID=A0A0B2A1A4_9MICO|nr:cytochrome b/b6 domain-containing protein [Microbacterium mangrovi]KHK95385.1 hypothetical protein LK09_19320 [Microbacterium mangrovi]
MGTVQLRRGLPRVAGGDAWPPAGVADAAAVTSVEPAVTEPAAPPSAPRAVVEAPSVAVAVPAAAAPGVALRRGLPRVAGGEAWPPAGTAGAAAAAEAAPTVAAQNAPSETPVVEVSPTAAPVAPSAPVAAAVVDAGAGVGLRRGLPRVAGGEPWPPAGAVGGIALRQAQGAEPAAQGAEPGAQGAEVAGPDVSVPLGFTRSVYPGTAPRHPAPAPEPVRIGPFTRVQWAGAVIVGGAGLLFAAAMVVLAVRVFVSLPFMVDFLHTYPGQYALPASAPVGFPVWLNWQHFLNVFFIVLIIRTGLGVRNQKRPTVFWTPRGAAKRKVSLTLWTHQALDTLWILNGLVFVVLLFATGQWMRLVPTSWAVFPNAISAALQYASLNWPHDDGWINYNSLQQLTYFGVVFLLAPLAIVTGVRMSTVWPKDAKRLNRVYPVEWARAVHFPVMIIFVLFVIVHVFLVFATGALRNLNHMYGASDAVNWVGFWWFAASLLVIAAGWAALRPLVLAPIARLFGTVSGR